MADSSILINLFNDLKKKIHGLASKNLIMDSRGVKHMQEVVTSCNTMDSYIDSHKEKDEFIIPIGVTYDQPYFTLTPRPRGVAGPTAAMQRYAAQQDQMQIDKIDRTIQMGRTLDANQHKPYFTIQ
jgi:hypothetical protein